MNVRPLNSTLGCSHSARKALCKCSPLTIDQIHHACVSALVRQFWQSIAGRSRARGTCPLLRPSLPALISNMSSYWPGSQPQMAAEEMLPGPLGSPRLMEAEIGEYCNGIFDWSLSDGRDDGSSDILMSHSFFFLLLSSRSCWF